MTILFRIIIIIIILIIIIIMNNNIIYLYYLEYTPKKVILNGELVHSKYINEIYIDGSIYFIGKVLNLVHNNGFNCYLKYSRQYPNIFYKFKYEYTNYLTINNEKMNGNYILIKYLQESNIIFFEKFVTIQNINSICDQIIKYSKITNNNIVLLDYFINNKNSKLYIKSIKYNKYKCDTKIYNIYNLILLLLNNKRIANNKKQFFYIIGILLDLINNIKLSDMDINIDLPINLFFQKIKNKKDDQLLISNEDQHSITKEYIIDGLDIEYTDIPKIKEIINKSNIPIINADFLKNNYIGYGLFSRVYKNGSRIIKMYKQEYMFHEENIDEYNISIKINNIKGSTKYFPTFYRCFLCKHNDEILICLEYDYITGNALNDFFKKKRNITSSNFIKIINNIMTANNYLNDNKIERQDNHINNIMITDEFDIKYIDFGRTFISTIDKNIQLDVKNYFNLLIKLSIITLEVIDNSKKQFILIKLIKEFYSKLGTL